MVAPTFGSARDVCAEGPSGLVRCALKGEITHYVRSLGEIRLSSGSRIYLRSADEPDRLRGLNLAGAWCDELASWRYPSAWHEGLMPAVRIDPAKVIVATTPRPTSLVKNLVSRTDGSVTATRGRTSDNAANLSATALAELEARYAGTRLGRQELDGELLEQVEGALWSFEQIDESRVDEPPEMDRIVVGVDPAVSFGEASDETGIVVVGVVGSGAGAHYFVLDDRSGRYTPQRWASMVASTFARWNADRVVAEVNQGGDMVEATLRQAAPDLPVRKVHASRGKQVRAEPVAALAEQGRLHHVGVHGELEAQMTSWTPGVGRSPDRVDALVWAVSALMSGGARRMVVLSDGSSRFASSGGRARHVAYDKTVPTGGEPPIADGRSVAAAQVQDAKTLDALFFGRRRGR